MMPHGNDLSGPQACEQDSSGATWLKNHRRYYKIAEITLRIDSDLPFAENTYDPRFKPFEVDSPGEDLITWHHHFSLPAVDDAALGTQIYRRCPWAIYRSSDRWTYLNVGDALDNKAPTQVVFLNDDYSQGVFHHRRSDIFQGGGNPYLSLLTHDQMIFARLMPDRQGFYIHSTGAIINGKGFLFVGHSTAGKTTIATMLLDHAEVLSDDRIIVRHWQDGIKIHGTWSYGAMPVVSPASAPLAAILFLVKAPNNRLIPLRPCADVVRRMMLRMVRPLDSKDWWEKTFTLMEHTIRTVPIFDMEFDLSGKIVEELKKL